MIGLWRAGRGTLARRAAGLALAGVLGVAGLTVAGGAPAGASSVPRAASPAAVYVPFCFPAKLKYEPALLYLSCGDGNSGVDHITWPSWGGATAAGSGSMFVDDCTPNCAAGKVHTEPAWVALSVETRDGAHEVYAYLVVTPKAPNRWHLNPAALALIKVGGKFTGPYTASLVDGETLPATNQLDSANSHYELVLQADGDLVAYHLPHGPTAAGEQAMWSSGTAGHAGDRLVLVPDGDLVLSTAAGAPIWSSHTAGNPGDHLVLQDDGNLVLYSSAGAPLWQTR